MPSAPRSRPAPSAPRSRTLPNGAAALLAALLLVGAGTAAQAQLVLSEVDLVANKVELVNIGQTNVDMSTWWWCNRVNGSPFYNTVAATSTIDATLSTATSLSVDPGEILVLDVAAAFLPEANGELGLYNTNAGLFTDPNTIEDYVVWGAAGIRDSVAQMAGIWVDQEFVAVAGMAMDDTIQLGLGQPGDAAGEYFVGTETLGVAQSLPEPSATVSAAAVLGTVLALRRRRRRL